MKVARPVWGGGKGGDNFKALPITIVSIHKNAECGWSFHIGRAEILRYVCQVPLYG